MTKRQSRQELSEQTIEDLRRGDPLALVEQKLVSAQNFVITQRAAYTKALAHRAQWVAVAHAAGWPKDRIAQRLGITPHEVDEALERSATSPAEFLRTEIARNGGHEDLSMLYLRERLEQAGSDDQ